MGKVVLIDDTREFRDRRECLVAWTRIQGVALLRSLSSQRIDKLWLDHDLGRDLTVWPVVRLLEDAAERGIRWDIGVVKLHASSSGRANEIGISLPRVGYRTERVADLRQFRRATPRPALGSGEYLETTPARGRKPHPDADRLGCTLYVAGHNVHWIQALHRANKPDVRRQSWLGHIVGVEGQRITVIDLDGRTHVFLNHDPARLVAINGGRNGGEVLVNDQYSILRIGTFCFSVARDAGSPLGPCRTDELRSDPSDEQLVERLESHHGFRVPAAPSKRENVSGTRQNGARRGRA